MVWNSRRSNAVGTKFGVASDNGAASLIGMEVLKNMNGTAADAAVAMAAALNVIQPATCGFGGDAWILYYENATKKVHCFCGQGKTPMGFTTDNISALGFANNDVPMHHPICIGVPGAPAAFCDLQSIFGSDCVTLSQLFKPAIELATNGFVMSEVNSFVWREGLNSLKYTGYEPNSEFLIDGQCPKAGQTIRLPYLAKTFQELGEFGKSAFYDGRIAKAVTDCVQAGGGVMTLEDLLAHETEQMEPLSVVYKSANTGKTVKVWEPPMTTQGVVTLEALELLETFYCDKSTFENEDCYYPILVDVLRTSFDDLSQAWLKAEVGHCPDTDRLLSDAFIRGKQRPAFRNACSDGFRDSGDTTYFCTADQWGNACSCVFSNYCLFGTNCMPNGYGFTLNNRARHFWEFMHKRFAPRTRPFATIIAGMLTNPESDDFMAAFGVMGGQNQPQAHLQTILNLIEFGLSPQEAMDKGRLRIDYDFFTSHYKVVVEDELEGIVKFLTRRGHTVQPPVSGYMRNTFGRGNVITKGFWWDQKGRFADGISSAYCVGTDPRGDGVALAY